MLRAYTRRGPLRLEWQVKPTTPAARSAWATQLTQFTAGEVWRTFGRRCEWPAAWYMQVLDGKAAIVPQLIDETRGLTELLDQLRQQHGPTLWVLQQLGISLGDLTREPANPSGQWLAQMRHFARDADRLGHNGQRLLQAAEAVATRRVRAATKEHDKPAGGR
jgi:hypothetical protein